MTGQIYDDITDRYIMHAVVIEPPSCYRCFSCGLCGDFKRPMVPEVAAFDGEGGHNALETCYGGEVPVTPGWIGDNVFAYDQNGCSWEMRFREANCPPLRGQFDSAIDGDARREYVLATAPDFQWDDPCDPEIADLVIIECQKARDLSKDCCDVVGGRYCGINLHSIFYALKISKILIFRESVFDSK